MQPLRILIYQQRSITIYKVRALYLPKHKGAQMKKGPEQPEPLTRTRKNDYLIGDTFSTIIPLADACISGLLCEGNWLKKSL